MLISFKSKYGPSQLSMQLTDVVPDGDQFWDLVSQTTKCPDVKRHETEKLSVIRLCLSNFSPMGLVSGRRMDQWMIKIWSSFSAHM